MFGIANLAAFLFAPFFGRFGNDIGPKLLYNTGAYMQASYCCCCSCSCYYAYYVLLSLLLFLLLLFFSLLLLLLLLFLFIVAPSTVNIMSDENDPFKNKILKTCFNEGTLRTGVWVPDLHQ